MVRPASVSMQNKYNNMVYSTVHLSPRRGFTPSLTFRTRWQAGDATGTGREGRPFVCVCFFFVRTDVGSKLQKKSRNHGVGHG